MSEGRTPKGLFIETYGCQMNVYDSERMRDVLAPLGYAPVDKPDDADLVVLNTCHIREKATEKVYSEIGRLKRHKERRQAEGKGMTIAIAYRQELALLLSAAVSLVVVVSLDEDLPQYITLMSAAATAILLLGRIRSRSKLIYVGLAAAIVAMLTDVGVSTLEDLAQVMGDASICGLGQAAPNPIRCVLEYFPHEVTGQVPA